MKKFGIFAFVFTVTLIILFIFIFFRSDNVEQRAGVEPEAVLLLVAKKTNDNDIYFFGSASGIVLNREEGYIATAKHVTDVILARPGIELFVMLGESLHRVDPVWQHRTADLSVVRLVSATARDVLPNAPVISRTRLWGDEGVHMVGYYGVDRLPLPEKCHAPDTKILCLTSVPLTIHLWDAPMFAISPEYDFLYIKVLTEVRLNNRTGTFSYDDLFFDHHISALLPNRTETKPYVGMSGGGLIDKRGQLYGILVTQFPSEAIVLFVPATEIPERFLPHK